MADENCHMLRENVVEPSRHVLIAAVGIVIIAGYKVLNMFAGTLLMCSCEAGGFQACTDYYRYLPIKPGCHCSCTPAFAVIEQYLWIAIFALMILYLGTISIYALKKA